MKTLWEEKDRRELAERLTSLDPARKPTWGQMNATQMLRHLAEWMRLANGELVCHEKRTALALPRMRLPRSASSSSGCAYCLTASTLPNASACVMVALPSPGT
jgi:hypothetical protein